MHPWSSAWSVLKGLLRQGLTKERSLLPVAMERRGEGHDSTPAWSCTPPLNPLSKAAEMQHVTAAGLCVMVTTEGKTTKQSPSSGRKIHEESKVGCNFIGTHLRELKTARRGRCVQNNNNSNNNKPVIVAPASNPGTWGAEAGRSLSPRSARST